MELLSCLRCLCGWDNFLSYFSPPDLVTIRFCREHQILMSSSQIILVSWPRQQDANSVSERISGYSFPPWLWELFLPLGDAKPSQRLVCHPAWDGNVSVLSCSIKEATVPETMYCPAWTGGMSLLGKD